MIMIIARLNWKTMLMKLLNTPVDLKSVKKKKNIHLEIVYKLLMTEDMVTYCTNIIKNKGKLINTSVDVQNICLKTGYVIRMHNDILPCTTYQK